VRWHRAGFRRYWRWKSRRRGGRPPVETELRALIRRMSIGNPLWGAPRIHGELLKLGFEVAQSSVAKYKVKRRVPPSQGWRTFLHNHAPDIAAMDLFVVPTIGFDLLYAFVIVRLDRRDLVWINVTANPDENSSLCLGVHKIPRSQGMAGSHRGLASHSRNKQDRPPVSNRDEKICCRGVSAILKDCGWRQSEGHLKLSRAGLSGSPIAV
jgi:hypothetical protein